MNIKRAFLVMAAVLLMPGLAMAGTSAGPGEFDFVVNIDFDPANFVDEVTVDIVCESVVAPNDDSEDNVGDQEDAQFEFDTLTLEDATCVVTASAVSGWSSSYAASGEGTESGGPSNCTFDAARFNGTTSVCDVTYTAAAETYTVFKVWNIDGTGGFDTDIDYTLKIVCDAGTIVGGSSGVTLSQCENVSSTCDFKTSARSGTSDTSFTVSVIPTTRCDGFELGIDNSSVSSSGSCGDFIGVDENESCTITNTSFFEGIPTLNQYGLAILALLMLGVGFVGFRRFV